MPEFSRGTMDRLLRKANNNEFRVSESAALELAAVLDEEGSKIAREAVRLSKHRQSGTVKKRDVRLAARSF